MMSFGFVLVSWPRPGDGQVILALRNHSWQCLRDHMVAEDRIRVSQVQGMQPDHCIIALVLYVLFYIHMLGLYKVHLLGS